MIWRRVVERSPNQPFWINPFLLKHCIACACGEKFFVLFVHCIPLPRKGWISCPTPSGWYEVIRGPRLKAEEWPRHRQYAARQCSPRRRQRHEVGSKGCRARYWANPSLWKLGASSSSRSSRGVSDVHHTLTEPRCTVGGNSRTWTPRMASFKKRWHQPRAGQDPRAGLGGRAAEVTRCIDGRRHGRNVPDYCQFLLQTLLVVPIWRCKSGEW